MPTYVYRCTNCEKVFEVEQRITEPSLTDHDCGPLGTLKRVMQPVGVAFKGSGFHINDYNASGLAPTSEKNSEPTAHSETQPAKEPSTPASAAPSTEGTPPPPAPSAPASSPAATDSTSSK